MIRAQDETYLIVGGVLAGGTFTPLPGYRVSDPVELVAGPGVPVVAALLGRGGQVEAEAELTAAPLCDGSDVTASLLYGTLPFIAGAQSLQVRWEGGEWTTTIGRPPTGVRFERAPSGTASGPQPVTWTTGVVSPRPPGDGPKPPRTASEPTIFSPAGRPGTIRPPGLRPGPPGVRPVIDPPRWSTLAYSPDDERWMPLVTSTTATSAVVDLDELPGGSSCRLRVHVSDGVLSASATTDQFAVPRKGIRVSILAPSPLDAVEGSVLLLGQAVDVEAGLLHRSDLVWRSDRDGPLGTGDRLFVELTSGRHVITLRHQPTGRTAIAPVDVLGGKLA